MKGVQSRLRFVLLGLLLLGAACTTPPPATPAPPTVPLPLTPPTDAPTPTPVARATLPPTWTPFVAPPTETPVYVPTADLTATAILLTPTLEICASFVQDGGRTNASFTYGDPALVAWMPFEAASEFDVRLLDANTDRTLLRVSTSANELVFSAELFAPDGSYYWLVRPLDANGVILCPAVGGVLFPIVR